VQGGEEREDVDDEQIEREIQALCDRRGLDVELKRDMRLSDLGLGSLDVSELVIRVEERLGCELDLGAVVLRRLELVDDLVGYMRSAVDLSR
jgi:acyl carrier protein